MPPVEFDTIPRFASHSAQDAKEAFAPSNVLELGSFESIKTRSKGPSLNDSGLIKDVEIPEIDSDDETTADKLMKEYSEDESADDSDYVPSEDGEEDEHELSVMTRSKGASLDDSELIKDVEVPEVDSEDETTIDKILKNYSDEEDVASDDDADYVPSEDSEDELEYDSDASISDDDYEHGVIEDVTVPKVSFNRTKVVINDVKVPSVSNHVVKDIHVGHTDTDELAAIAHRVVDLAAGYSIVQAGIQTLDTGLELVEKIVAPVSVTYKEHVQTVRRHLRAVRRSGSGPSKGLFAHFVELFKVNWFLSFIGLTLTFDAETVSEKESTGKKNSSQDYCDDEESTVYKLMQEYDSQDDEDYVPSDCSEDSMEFDSDCSDDETVIDKIMKDYSEADDSDFVLTDESEEDEDSLEYDSDAEVSEDSDSDYDSSDVEDCSEDETLLEKIMKDYSDEESDFDSDYAPSEDTEEALEYDSDASVTETEDSESEDDSESDDSVTETEDSESEEESQDESATEVEFEIIEGEAEVVTEIAEGEIVSEVIDEEIVSEVIEGEIVSEVIDEEIVDDIESQDSDVDEAESQDSQLDDE